MCESLEEKFRSVEIYGSKNISIEPGIVTTKFGAPRLLTDYVHQVILSKVLIIYNCMQKKSFGEAIKFVNLSISVDGHSFTFKNC